MPSSSCLGPRHTGSTHTDIQTLTFPHNINVNKSLIEKKEKLSEPISETGFASVWTVTPG